MQINKISKVVFTPEDINNAIAMALLAKGLKSKTQIRLRFKTITTVHGMMESDETVLDDLILECESIEGGE